MSLADIEHLPKIVTDVDGIRDILLALDPEIVLLREDISQLIKELYITTTEKYIDRWEQDFSLPYDGSLTLEQRRQRVKNKLARKKILNWQNLRLLIKNNVVKPRFYIVNEAENYHFKIFLEQQPQRQEFDLSKFTVVGSPTITEDGVASGFLKDTEKGYDSSPNCIRIPSFTLGQLKDKPWSMECSFVLPTITSPTNKSLYSLGQTSRWEAWSNVLSVSTSGESFQIVSRFGNDESNSGNIAVRGWTTSSSIGMIRGNSYTYITDFDGVSLYTYKIKDNKTGNILAQYKYTPTVEDKNLYMVNEFPNETINIGTANSAHTNQYSGWTGSIDLKQFSITVDGQKVFSGIKNIDYITNELRTSLNQAKPAYLTYDIIVTEFFTRYCGTFSSGTEPL